MDDAGGAVLAQGVEDGVALHAAHEAGLEGGVGGVRGLHQLEAAQALVRPTAILAQGDEGVVAAGADLGHQTRQAHRLGLLVDVGHQLLAMVANEVGVVGAGHEVRVLHHLAVELDGGFEAANLILAQGATHEHDRLVPRAAVGDEQRGGGVVAGGEAVARADARVDAHALPAGGDVAGDEPGVGREVVLWILAVHAHLHGVQVGLGVALVEAQLGAEADGDLLFHQVDAVAAFGDAVLHLQAGVGLDEVRTAILVHQELDGGQGMVAHGLDEFLGVPFEFLAQFGSELGPGRGGDLDELLVVALHRAVALVEDENVAVQVGHGLTFDVAHAGEQLFHVQARIAEAGLGQGRGLHKGVLQLRFLVDLVDAATAAAALGLEHNREADLLGDLARLGDAHRLGRAGHHGHADLLGELAHGNLVAE